MATGKDLAMVELGNLIDVVSPSKLECAQRCMAQFFFRYVERAPRVFRAELQFGNAADRCSNSVYASKQRTGDTPTRGDVQDRFAAEWDWFADAVDDWGEDDRGALLDVGVNAMAHWRDAVADRFTPTGVQLDLSVPLLDPVTQQPFTLRGIIDVTGSITVNEGPPRDTTADLKTSARAYQPDAFLRKFQPAAYTLLTGVPTFEFHVLTRTARARTQVLRATLPDTARESFVRVAGMLRRQITHAFTTGDWIPNRSGFMCSRKFCEHWRRCEQAHGGEVPA